jgi:hypothetical protein
MAAFDRLSPALLEGEYLAGMLTETDVGPLFQPET